MIIGAYDKKITIEQSVSTRGSDGSPIQTWQTYKSVWANVVYRNIRGKERVEQDRETAINVAEFRIRDLDAPDVNEKMRINFDRGYWDITAISKMGRKDGIVLFAEYRY
jgi:SPP1 family predicted phage head-tail adaptor